MADIFISYSRKDITFVRRLHARLVEQGRDVWVDWEDIPRGSDWMNEIYAAVESADTFLLIVSPDSMASQVCNQEIHHAIQKNKRIIPVIYRDIDERQLAGDLFDKDWETQARDNWRAVKHINWQFFRESDDFEKALAELVGAVDTDIEYVRAHTRLLLRAREWENHNGNSSFLLKGAELEQANTWLGRSRDKAPLPTDAQRAYIDASNQEAQRLLAVEQARQARELQLQRQNINRLRYLVGVLVISLVGAGVLIVRLNQLLMFQQQVGITIENFYVRAGEYLNAERYGEANAEYSRVIELNSINYNPDYADALYRRGLARYHTFDLEAAIEDYGAYLQNYPDTADVYLNRAQAEVLLGHYANAEMDFAQAGQLDARHSTVSQNFQKLLGSPRAIAPNFTDFERLVADFQFERLPVDMAELQWVQYYGNSLFAFQQGRMLSYDRISQGLHSGLDLGARPGVPVYAGVNGRAAGSYDPRRGLRIIVGDFTVIYYNMDGVPAFKADDLIAPDTIIGVIEERDRHVHVEVRFQNWIINPLLFMPDSIRLAVFQRFNDFSGLFASTADWSDWQNPMEQPVIVASGPVIGPMNP
jgi:tetratricopeptide (TPR) repeat protein